jgi:dihydrofolate synthase/folylpolyglutamate synthase
MTYSETIQYLYDRLPAFHQIGGAAYKPGLENTIRLMDGLNNPQNQYRTIHIAGTNGKGSVSHLLAAVLHEAGYKVGLYTSPHLVDFRERIRVNGKMIEQQYVIDFVNQHQNLFVEIEPSFFEATMAMAFDYFASCQVDVAVIEVGLGGRLDSTNIIKPNLSVITNISFDHVAFLGNSLAKIAFEKAGIIKADTPVVIGEALPETRAVFIKKALQENAPIHFAEEHYFTSLVKYQNAKMQVKIYENEEFVVGLYGNYQLKNIATVCTVIEQLKIIGYQISKDAMALGFEEVLTLTGLRGRWELLRQSPTVVCDTGHNEAGIRQVVEQLQLEHYNNLRIVIGMVSDKDIRAVLKLLPSKAVYYFTQANIPRALSATDLQAKAMEFELYGKSYLSVKQSVEAALNDAAPDDFVLIGGSNFVVGEALTCF